MITINISLWHILSFYLLPTHSMSILCVMLWFLYFHLFGSSFYLSPHIYTCHVSKLTYKAINICRRYFQAEDHQNKTLRKSVIHEELTWIKQCRTRKKSVQQHNYLQLYFMNLKHRIIIIISCALNLQWVSDLPVNNRNSSILHNYHKLYTANTLQKTPVTDNRRQKDRQHQPEPFYFNSFLIQYDHRYFTFAGASSAIFPVVDDDGDEVDAYALKSGRRSGGGCCCYNNIV